MPNWKYPCLNCNKPVKNNQKGLECNTCKKWIHKKCTDLTDLEYNFLEENENLPFYCLPCHPRPHYADVICENLNIDTNNLNNSAVSTLDLSSANSSDFVYVDESDSDLESRGLNFESLPARCTNTLTNTKKNKSPPKFTFVRTVSYKYPCLVCLTPCKENIQDSICCTLCDEWVHRKCTDLTLDQFKIYCSPDHAGDPYYCANCLYGNCSRVNFENQTCLNVTEIESMDINDTIHNLCPNSVFNDKEDIHLSEYYTIDELNVEIQKKNR